MIGSNFITRHRDGAYVIKELRRQPSAMPKIVAAAQHAGTTALRAYISTLRAANVALPPGLTVVSEQPLAVRHRLVHGEPLIDCAPRDPTRFVQGVRTIAGSMRSLDHTNARLSTNLANFCLIDGRIVLTDVLPPLIPSIQPIPYSLYDLLVTEVSLSTEVALDALIGYAGRALLPMAASASTHYCEGLVSLGRHDGPKPIELPFPASWFRARAVLALAALAGKVTPEAVHDFFTLTSIKGFQRLTEPQQAHRIGRVGSTIERFDLS